MSTAQDILTSITTKIPDVDQNGVPLYETVPKDTLLLWINDACRLIAAAAPIIHDWTGVQSVTGQDVYYLGTLVNDVVKGWFDLKPLTMSSEGDDIFISKVQGTSWWMAPHAQGDVQFWHIWPSPSRTGSVTTLTANVSASTALNQAIPITDSAGFMAFGFVSIESEVCRYANIPVAGAPGNLTNVLRGQAGTMSAAHLAGATVTELNLMFQVTRLPRPLLVDTDPVDLPRQLWPLVELFVLANVREMEQRHEVALADRQEFMRLVEQLANKATLVKPRQGLQVRTTPMGPSLYNGRLYIP